MLYKMNIAFIYCLNCILRPPYPISLYLLVSWVGIK